MKLKQVKLTQAFMADKKHRNKKNKKQKFDGDSFLCRSTTFVDQRKTARPKTGGLYETGFVAAL